VDSSPDSVVALRQQLTDQGVFVAVMLLARTANGLIEWNDASGRTLREHSQRQLKWDGDRS
jgi:hypothetical protein